MLRGNHPATVDAKFRLKVPTAFRNYIRDSWGNELFLTSFNGDNLLAYPLASWSEFEARLDRLPQLDPSRQRLMSRINYFGAMTTMDKQGRVLVPQVLRETAGIEGEVVVMGQRDHLEVWNHEVFRKRLEAAPLTDADFAKLADMGI